MFKNIKKGSNQVHFWTGQGKSEKMAFEFRNKVEHGELLRLRNLSN